MTPLSIFLHELGHYTAARVFGYPALLKATSVASDLDQAPAWLQAFQAAAGPLVTVIVTAAAAWFYSRRGTRLWALSLAMAAPHRFLVLGAYLAVMGAVTAIGGRFGGSPNFDEFNAAQAMGLPIFWVASLITALLILYWTWLIRRIPKGKRILSIASVAAGAAAGMFLWVLMATPLLAALQS
jgi:hypothetical protein